MVVAREYLERQETPHAAYMRFQRCLCDHFVARGGTEEEFVSRFAIAFRRRYGWMLAGSRAA